MLVRDIMSRPVTVEQDASMREVAALMLRKGVGMVVVLGADGAARGIVTERDFIEHGELPYSERGGPTILRMPLGQGATLAYLDARTQPAHRIMRPLDAVLAEDDRLEKALDLLMHRGKRHAVVLRGDRPVGVVSHHEFLILSARGPVASRALELV
ncbi:MAG: CBS domain-containing protein [Halobacteriales archaeon]|nr:CBS domain-containing protein [Halobacteriales archaeon]